MRMILVGILTCGYNISKCMERPLPLGEQVLVRALISDVRNQLDALSERFGLARMLFVPALPLDQISPLGGAIKKNDVVEVQRLLTSKADPNSAIIDKNHAKSALRIAFESRASGEIIEALLENGADINDVQYEHLDSHCPPILVAADHGCLWYVARLLALNANTAVVHKSTDESLLHKLAKQEGALWLVKKLVHECGRGNDVHEIDNMGNTPLDYAHFYNRLDTEKFLQEIGNEACSLI